MTLTEYRRRYVYRCACCGQAGHLAQECKQPVPPKG